MIDLGKLFLPLILDYDSITEKITFRSPEYGTDDYIFFSKCMLQLDFLGEAIFIDYYCEDDIMLSDLLELDESIASGDLLEETFGAIQARALNVLRKHIVDSQQELFEHFDSL